MWVGDARGGEIQEGIPQADRVDLPSDFASIQRHDEKENFKVIGAKAIKLEKRFI